MIVKYKIDVGDHPNKMKKKLAEYVGLKITEPEEKTEQKGKGYDRTLAGLINKKYTGDQIKKYLDKGMYKTKTKKAELVVMLINKMNTNKRVDEKISKELGIDTAEDEGGTYNQIGGGADPQKGLTTTQIDELMSDEKTIPRDCGER